MKSNIPKTLDELKELPWIEFTNLWSKYFDIKPRTNKHLMLRPLWYKVQCEIMKRSIKPQYIKRLDKYASNIERFDQITKQKRYELIAGTKIKKNYKGDIYWVEVQGEDEFVFKEKLYSNLSAIAQVICGQRVSGPDFFGLTNKGKV